MAASQRRYSKEEFARRGDALVESKVRPHLTPADEDKFVAIDVETGEYELDRNEMKAADGCGSVFPIRKSGWCMSPWAISIASAGMAYGVSHDRRDRPGARTSDPADDTRVSRPPARDRSGGRFGLHRLAHVAPPR